ncbi:MAG: hypothetical protein AAF417_03135 [Pseudomonadota bacterium]
MIAWLLVAHLVVLGYWLGSELVINSTFRYVCRAENTPFNERARLMNHVMDADQHVRYALALQFTLGVMISSIYGFVPGENRTAVGAAVAGIAWLMLIEAAHRLRNGNIGRRLATADRALRYASIIVLLAVALQLLGGDWAVPTWLRWKLGAFAAIVACGVGIRLALIAFFRTWTEMATSGVTPERNATVKRIYVRATSILVALWFLIAAVVYLSVEKPG